jgi:hypothetical protein
MGLSKKGSRKISVDGINYLWIASGNDGWIDLIIGSSLGQGQKLFAQFNYNLFEDPVSLRLKQGLSITPNIVRQVINYGLQFGWTPEEKVPDLNIGYLDNKIDINSGSGKEFPPSPLSILCFLP